MERTTYPLVISTPTSVAIGDGDRDGWSIADVSPARSIHGLVDDAVAHQVLTTDARFSTEVDRIRYADMMVDILDILHNDRIKLMKIYNNYNTRFLLFTWQGIDA